MSRQDNWQAMLDSTESDAINRNPEGDTTMSDITHSNVFTNNDTVPRLRRILDEGPTLPERAVDHEIAPYVQPAEKSGSELIAEKSIAVLDETAQYVLAQIPPMRDRLDQVEQMVIKASVDGRENIRAQVRIMEAAMKVVQQIDAQLNEAVKPLAALTNGK